MEFGEPFPIIFVADVERSLRFYRDNCGFAPAYRWPEEGALEFAYLTLGASGIGLASRDAATLLPGRSVSARDAPQAAPFELCLYVDDVDRATAGLQVAGARVVRPPEDEPWGERRAYVVTPDGHLLHLAQTLERG